MAALTPAQAQNALDRLEIVLTSALATHLAGTNTPLGDVLVSSPDQVKAQGARRGAPYPDKETAKLLYKMIYTVHELDAVLGFPQMQLPPPLAPVVPPPVPQHQHAIMLYNPADVPEHIEPLAPQPRRLQLLHSEWAAGVAKVFDLFMIMMPIVSWLPAFMILSVACSASMLILAAFAHPELWIHGLVQVLHAVPAYVQFAAKRMADQLWKELLAIAWNAPIPTPHVLASNFSSTHPPRHETQAYVAPSHYDASGFWTLCCAAAAYGAAAMGLGGVGQAA